MLVKKQSKNHLKILNVATKLAIIHGLDKTYVSMIAKEMNSHHSLLYTYYESIESLRKSILEKAIKEGITEILMEGILTKRLKKSDLSEEMLIKISRIFENAMDK